MRAVDRGEEATQSNTTKRTILRESMMSTIFTGKNVTGRSPYTIHNIDVAINHLERILSGEALDAVFSRTYWRGRIVQALSTPGIASSQQERLRRMLDRLTAF
jgi:hypothetical protein